MTKRKRRKLTHLDLPKQEDILGEYDLDSSKAVLVQVTPENAEYLARLAVAITLDGQLCRFRDQPFASDQFDDVVFAGKDEAGNARYAHGDCWRAQEDGKSEG